VPFALAVLLLAAAPGARAASSGRIVEIVKVQGVVDPALSSYVRGTVARAERSGSTVVLQIDSRGSYGDEAVSLGRFLRRASVPVVAWVGPSGARASGGAVFLVYSASLVAVSPGAGIGPARPFDLAVRASRESPGDVRANRATLLAASRGSGARPSAVRRLADGAVLPAGPALRAGAASVAAASVPDLLRRVDGRTVRAGDGTVALRTSGANAPVEVQFRDIGFIGRLLHAVSTPTAVYVLLLVAMWGIAFELTQPGIGMAGGAGVLALGFAIYGLTVVPVSWLGIALLVLGTAAQGLDVVLRRFGPLTVAGTGAFLAGSLLAWWGVSPAVDLSLWLVVLATVGGFLLFGFGMTVALEARERVRAAQVGLVGLVGETRSDLNPEGGVHVKGALWRARSMNGHIPSGRKVRVRGIDGLILRVEEERDQP
jgi:membrane-bound serine protease (ClpP class)